jgi:predicted ester cyclase
VEVLDLLVDEAGAMYEVRLTGTHEGTLNGLPPTGRRMDVRGVSKLAFEDGRVTEHRVYFDTREVMEQLGMTFPTVLFQLPRLLLGALRGGR